ncbi:MAG: Biphenyl-2,3-diol 1,2-dioxygenase, partial [uncultured Blastococcus sp.]
ARPAPQPRRALRPRRRAQPRLLPGRARFPREGRDPRPGGVPPGGGLDQRPRPRPLRDRRRRRTLAGRSRHRRPLPPGVGGRHARRAVPHPWCAARGGRAGRRLRSRHHEGALRRRPRRDRVRGLLAAAGRPDHPGRGGAGSDHAPAGPGARDRALRRTHPRRGRGLGPRL